MKVGHHPSSVTEPIYPVGTIFQPLVRQSLFTKVILPYSASRSMASRLALLLRDTPAGPESGRLEIGLAPARLTTVILQKS